MVDKLRIVKNYENLDELVQIEKEALRLYCNAGYDPSFWSVNSAEQFAKYCASNHLWVAVLENRAIGFAVVDLFGDFAHLEEIDVLPEYFRQGIGSKLLTEVIHSVISIYCKHISLRTFKTTPWSINLYRKFGFVECDDQMLEYLTPYIKSELQIGIPIEDRVSMKLDLTEFD